MSRINELKNSEVSLRAEIREIRCRLDPDCHASSKASLQAESDSSRNNLGLVSKRQAAKMVALAVKEERVKEEKKKEEREKEAQKKEDQKKEERDKEERQSHHTSSTKALKSSMENEDSSSIGIPYIVSKIGFSVRCV